MASDLTSKTSAAAVTMRSPPPASVTSAQASMIRRGGKWFRDPLSPEARSWISKRLSSLDRLIAAPGDDPGVGKPLLLLFAAFPATAISDEMARARVVAYRMALREFPLWCVERAVERWICGEVDAGARFCPSPPELKATCRTAMDVAEAERVTWKRLLDAQDRASIPPAPEGRGVKVIQAPRFLSSAEAPKAKNMQAQPLPEAERRLIEAIAAGATITDDMIAAAERSQT